MTDYDYSDEQMYRPSMKQDDHPEHNMPPSEHEGTTSGADVRDARDGRRISRNYKADAKEEAMSYQRAIPK